MRVNVGLVVRHINGGNWLGVGTVVDIDEATNRAKVHWLNDNSYYKDEPQWHSVTKLMDQDGRPFNGTSEYDGVITDQEAYESVHRR